MVLEETQIRILEGSSIKRSQGDNWGQQRRGDKREKKGRSEVRGKGEREGSLPSQYVETRLSIHSFLQSFGL